MTHTLGAVCCHGLQEGWKEIMLCFIDAESRSCTVASPYPLEARAKWTALFGIFR